MNSRYKNLLTKNKPPLLLNMTLGDGISHQAQITNIPHQTRIRLLLAPKAVILPLHLKLPLLCLHQLLNLIPKSDLQLVIPNPQIDHRAARQQHQQEDTSEDQSW